MNASKIFKITPKIKKNRINGKAILTSNFAPVTEVKVEAPVKFNDRYAEMAVINNVEIIKCVKVNLNIIPIITAQINPVTAPFNANDLNGIYGRKTGVKIQPVITEPIKGMNSNNT